MDYRTAAEEGSFEAAAEEGSFEAVEEEGRAQTVEGSFQVAEGSLMAAAAVGEEDSFLAEGYMPVVAEVEGSRAAAAKSYEVEYIAKHSM